MQVCGDGFALGNDAGAGSGAGHTAAISIWVLGSNAPLSRRAVPIANFGKTRKAPGSAVSAKPAGSVATHELPHPGICACAGMAIATSGASGSITRRHPLHHSFPCIVEFPLLCPAGQSRSREPGTSRNLTTPRPPTQHKSTHLTFILSGLYLLVNKS